ncbi:MAG: sigma-70 family RNA polymerase sigma factor [bacterium]
MVAMNSGGSYLEREKEDNMSGSRIVYQNWIAEIGIDPEVLKTGRYQCDPLLEAISLDDPAASEISREEVRRINREEPGQREIRSQVSRALEALNDEERELIVHFYLMGKSYRELSDRTGRSVHKLEALHKRAVKKLRKKLAGFVEQRFGVVAASHSDCPICNSPYAAEIDRLISNRDKTTTWKPLITTLREKYDLKIGSPQTLIGHEKYHGPCPTPKEERHEQSE